jgi:hypothetical protein
MGQALFNPPNVAGWPGGARWINSSSWMERVNFANFLCTAREDGHTMSPPFAALIDRHGLTTPEAIVDHFADRLLDGQISPAMRRALLQYLASGDPKIMPRPTRAPGASRPAGTSLPAKPFLPAFVDQKVRGLVYLLLASPEYELL